MKTIKIWLAKTFKFRLSLLLVNVILGGAMNACNDEVPVPTPIRIAGPEDVTSFDAVGGGKLCFQRDGDFLIIDGDTKTSWGLSSVYASTMSPDGKYIAHVLPGSFSREPEILLYDIESNKNTKGSRNKSGGSNPSWTADSKDLLFVRSNGQTNELIRQSIAGDASSTITTGVQFYSQISASVSDKLVFKYTKAEAGKKEFTGIMTINMDGTHSTQLAADSLNQFTVNKFTWSPAWSPNGEKIAYVVTQFDPGNSSVSYKQIDIIIMDKLGANAITIASLKPVAGAPGLEPSITWSPDGTRLAFNMAEPTGTHIYIVKPDGSGLTKLTSRVEVSDGHLSWSK